MYYVILRVIFPIITIILGIVLCVRVIPYAKLILKIYNAKMKLKVFKRKWRRVERHFRKDEKYRLEMANNPSKMSSFFTITDTLSGTDYTRGLQSHELKKLFMANPGLMAERVEEYLHKTKRATT